jgi:Penicillin-insensitive murein endopeptidase
VLRFVEEAWPFIDAAPYQPNWAIDALCEHLQAVTEGSISRLLANFPPRCGKTIITSVCWIAWFDGCLAGAVALPITGPAWQVMRVSRNRCWSHPSLVAFIERLADTGKKVGWNGLLIGDLSQPRGGPMLCGHSSHQIGLDVDIWFTPMPDHELSPEEREFNMALNMAAKDRPAVDPKVWTYERTALVRAAALAELAVAMDTAGSIWKRCNRMCGNGGATASLLNRPGAAL